MGSPGTEALSPAQAGVSCVSLGDSPTLSGPPLPLGVNGTWPPSRGRTWWGDKNNQGLHVPPHLQPHLKLTAGLRGGGTAPLFYRRVSRWPSQAGARAAGLEVLAQRVSSGGGLFLAPGTLKGGAGQMRGCRELDPGSWRAAVLDSCCDQSCLVPVSQGPGAWPFPWVAKHRSPETWSDPSLAFQPSTGSSPPPPLPWPLPEPGPTPRDIYRANEGAQVLQGPD